MERRLRLVNLLAHHFAVLLDLLRHPGGLASPVVGIFLEMEFLELQNVVFAIGVDETNFPALNWGKIELFPNYEEDFNCLLEEDSVYSVEIIIIPPTAEIENHILGTVGAGDAKSDISTANLRRNPVRNRRIPSHSNDFAMMSVDEVLSFDGVMDGPHVDEWRKALGEELMAIKECGTMIPAKHPPGRQVITSKMIFKRKLAADGSVARDKAMLEYDSMLKNVDDKLRRVFYACFDLLCVVICVVICTKANCSLSAKSMSTDLIWFYHWPMISIIDNICHIAGEYDLSHSM